MSTGAPVADAYEQEADRTADRVATAAAPPDIRHLPQPPGGVAALPAAVDRAISSPGRSLDPDLRQKMEQRLGHDFSRVRMHADAAAAQSALEVNAHAYTVGQDVVFGAGRFVPDTAEGQRLIAHELTHVVQQSGGHRTLQRKPDVASPAEATDPISEEDFPGHAWHLVGTTAGRGGSPSAALIRAIVEQEAGIDLADAAVTFKYRNDVQGGTIRPSYFTFRNPAKGLVVRAFAELEGFHPERKPDAKTLRAESHSYRIYIFTLRSGNPAPTYAFSAPLSSASPPPEVPAPKADPQRTDVGSPVLPAMEENDPAASPRYIDTLFQTWSYSMLNGASALKWKENGKEKEIGIPLKDLVQDDTRIFVRLKKVHNSKDEALRTVNLYVQASPAGYEYYTFYRGPDGVILPTSYSIDSTPLFHAMWPGMKQDIGRKADEIRKGLQPLANAVNPIPFTQVDEYGNLGFSSDPLSVLGLLRLRRPRGTTSGDSPPVPQTPKPKLKPAQTEPSVWVQLKDGRVREYQPSEVKGDLARGAEVSTVEGPGKVVGRGDPPHSSQVIHAAPPPLLTPAQLNEPVPLRSGLTGKARRLTADERKGANHVLGVLDRVRQGDAAAINELAGLRPKELKGDLAGWYEVDLLRGNPGGLNQMRLLFRQAKNGDFEARLLQMH